MTQHFTELRHTTTRAADQASLGRLEDALYDRASLRLEYFVIATGPWLPGRRALIPAQRFKALGERAIELDVLRADFAGAARGAGRGRDGVDAAVDAWVPVPWGGHLPRPAESVNPSGARDARPPLRSVAALLGSGVRGPGGPVGRAQDVVLDLDALMLDSIVVRVGELWEPETTALPASLMTDVEPGERLIHLGVPRDAEGLAD